MLGSSIFIPELAWFLKVNQTKFNFINTILQPSMNFTYKPQFALIFIAFFLFNCSSGTSEDPKEFNLTVNANPSEGGTVTPANGTYKEGTRVSIRATPQSGFVFKEWNGSIAGVENPISITMDSNKSITGVFEEVVETCDQGVFEGDVFLQTQDQLNDFAALCYTGISGNLFIFKASVNPAEGPVVNDISPLNNLTEVGGEIRIDRNDISNLSGLENITSASGITLGQLPNLENLNGIENLIQNTINSGKTDFSIFLGGCPKITSISLFRGLTVLENLSLGSLESLSSFEGLNDLERVNNRLLFGSFPLMNSFNNLENLVSVGYWLIINFNDTFTSMAGLENLTSVGDTFFIDFNSALESLAGLESLSVSPSIRIRSNEALSSLAGLNLAASDFLLLEDNPALTNLSGMNFGINPTVFIEINNCIGLTSLQGLEELTQTEGLYIRENSNLTNLSGLENLTTVQNRILIDNNENLSDFCALSTLFNNNGLQAGSWSVSSNLYNPSYSDMQSNNCSN